MKLTILSVLMAIALTGCGSSNSGPAQRVAKVQSDPVLPVAPVAPKATVKLPAATTPPPIGFGTVVILRDPSHPTPGCMMDVYVNQELVHQFDADQKATFILQAGDQVVAADNSDGRSGCAIVQGERHQLIVSLRAGDVKNLHVQLVPGKGAVIEVTER